MFFRSGLDKGRKPCNRRMRGRYMLGHVGFGAKGCAGALGFRAMIIRTSAKSYPRYDKTAGSKTCPRLDTSPTHPAPPPHPKPFAPPALAGCCTRAMRTTTPWLREATWAASAIRGGYYCL